MHAFKLFRSNGSSGRGRILARDSNSSVDSGISTGGSSVRSSNNGPGSPTGAAPGSTVFRVTVPEGVQPGQELQVYTGSRIVRVRCPVESSPGQTLRITVPVEPRNGNNSRHPGNGGDPSSQSFASPATLPPDSPNVEQVAGDDDGAYMVTIPDGVQGGQQFPVTIRGQQLVVTAPIAARPGTKVRVVAPPPPLEVTESPPGVPFEVIVPPGALPGQPFALLAGGVRVLVTCPINATPGQKIRFKLPLALTQKPKPQSEVAAIKLRYNKDGWTRTIREWDMKFQWVRMDDKGDIDTNTRFEAEKSAYVRALEFRPGVDPRTRDGVLSLVPANEAFVDSSIEGVITYADIAEAQVKGFEDKALWFQEKCALLAVEWEDGHIMIKVRRNFLLEDSVNAVMSLCRRDLRKVWRFTFIGERGVDAGGLAREWFELVTKEVFDPDRGLWQSSVANQMCVQINPASKYLHDDYLVIYRFLGRVMGKALFNGQLVAGHMVPYIYKHMLGWPVTFKDIEGLDEEYYNNLKQLPELDANGEDLSMLDVDFTTTEEIMGVKEVVELVEGGKEIEVTNENFPEYLEAYLKYRMMMAVKPQLTELLLGFFDVIPEPLLTVFDFQELELLMCGLPVIDLDDWKEHTEYSGDFEHVGPDYPTCQWFWAVVEEFDQEMKARLLQFVTGTSGVPARGFGVLHGNDGNIRKFTIHVVSVHTCLYPRAHTCFNRIDLPAYQTVDVLRDCLKLAVTMAATGFDIE